MLQFIVLGYVPGTSVQLSFYVIMLALLAGSTLFSSIKLAQYHHSQRKLMSIMPFLLKKQLRVWQRQNTLSV